MKYDDHRWEWIRAYADGSADEAATRALEAALRTDPSLRAALREYLNIDGALALHALGTATRRLASAKPQQRRKVWTWAGMGLAAAIAVMAFFLPPESPRQIARITETRNARWEDSTLPTEPGSFLTSGFLRLADGLAQIRFVSGADVTIEGPAELEILGSSLCRLRRGSLVAHVPEPARGFMVLTDSATLIDHGTDFGISADGNGHAKVHVLQGEVELRHTNGQAPLRLTSLETVGITPHTLLPKTPMEEEPRRLPEPLEHPSSSTEITTRTGEGAAAYVWQNRVAQNQSSHLLLLKSCTEEGYGRKVLLRFDLRHLPKRKLLDACRLTLHLSPTGYGYAARSGDARIGIYAVTDQDQDTWNASSVCWENQPATHESASKVDLHKAIRVADFKVSAGVQTGSFSITSNALNQAIASDPNQMLTLILVRENPMEDHGGVALGIAGNNHPLLPPPTLRIP